MRRSEMQMPVWPFYQPFHYRRRFVGGIVIQNQVNFFAGRNLLGNVNFNFPQKCQKILGSVSGVALSENFAALHIEGGKE